MWSQEAAPGTQVTLTEAWDHPPQPQPSDLTPPLRGAEGWASPPGDGWENGEVSDLPEVTVSERPTNPMHDHTLAWQARVRD